MSGQTHQPQLDRRVSGSYLIPVYAGIEDLRETGDQVQWGGERLCDGWRFPTADGRARFVAVTPQEATLPPGWFLPSTRWGKRFNSMVWRDIDPVTGGGRDALFLAPGDAAQLAVGEGDAVRVRSAAGEVRATVKLASIAEGNVQMHFPEANPLLDRSRHDPVGMVPDDNAEVELIPVR